MKRIVLAGGGSAGHVEPALAVADAIIELNPKIMCEILGTNSGIESHLVPNRGYPLRVIPKVAAPRRLNLQALIFPISIWRAMMAARRVINGSSALIGFGGYVSAAAYLAAKSLRVPIVIHEANAKPGWANRLGRHFADVIAVNFDSLLSKWPGSILTGMPIRRSIIEVSQADSNQLKERRRSCAENWGLDPERPIIAVFGGSLGATRINQAIAELISIAPDKYQILHAVGLDKPLPMPTSTYRPLQYFDDMASVYTSSNLVIARSGAVTCSELLAVGRFAVLVPLAHGNGEQIANAQELVVAGQALSVRDADFTGHWLAENLDAILERAQLSKIVNDNRSLSSAVSLAKLTLKAAEL